MLIVFPYRPWPVEGGGAARLWSMIGALREASYSVALLVPDPLEPKRGTNLPEIDYLLTPHPTRGLTLGARQLPREWCAWGHRIGSLLTSVLQRVGGVWPSPTASGKDRSIDRLIPGPPGKWEWSAIGRAVAAACALLEPVAVIAHFASTARWLEAVPRSIRRILDTHDVQHLRSHAAQGCACPAWNREEEAAELRRADVLLAIQEGEAAILREMVPDRTVITVGHVPLMTVASAAEAGSREVVFVGNDYPPNNEALRVFLADCWPQVRAAVPDATFCVCGLVGRSLPKRLPAGVINTGFLPDLSEVYAGAAVVINPVECGTGLKIKTVEALMHGKCVVGSPHSLHGLPEDAGGAPVCVVSTAAMAPALARLLLEPPARQQWEARARAYAEKYLSRRVVYGPLVEVLQEAVGDQRVVAGH